MKADITKIQRFSTHDGPGGIRTTVFFRGCPLRCFWCHNPETAVNAPRFYYNPQFCIGCTSCASVCENGVHIFTDDHTLLRENCKGCMKCTEACPSGAIESCSFSLETEKIVDIALRDSAFYQSGGGITVSGGEPMMQPEACLELLKKSKENGLKTAVETCGVFDKKYLPELCRYADILLWDYKDGNPERLKKNTGAALTVIEENLIEADRLGAVTEIHSIMLHGVNTDDANINAIANIFSKLANCRGVKLVPYHPYGSSKSKRLGISDTSDKTFIPGTDEITQIEEKLISLGVKVVR